MKTPNPRTILHVIDSLDWSGHIELGDNDKNWLAMQISDALNPPGDKLRCESCGELQPIVIRTPLGLICEDCIDGFSDQATDIREQME